MSIFPPKSAIRCRRTESTRFFHIRTKAASSPATSTHLSAGSGNSRSYRLEFLGILRFVLMNCEGILQIKPELLGCPKILGEPSRHLGGNSTLLPNNVIDGRRRNAKLHRQPISGDAHRFQKLLRKNFSRMYRPPRRTLILDTHHCAPADPPLNAQLRHILYPTDLSVESAQAASYVVSLARQHGARLTLVHVVERYTGAANEAQEQEFEAQFRSQVSGEFPHNWTFRTQVGPVDQTILELADQGRVGLIVLGLRSPRSFVHPHGWPHAYKIACEACCPVLTIRCSPGVEL